ncbi:phage protein Gp36 family protein [Pedobacter sp. WC2423]|uniref:phage protein Gp36 family protein n=1 Tax=Pedobacter sp. WC2423 TaxID=3234142 RepID=UPI003464F70A
MGRFFKDTDYAFQVKSEILRLLDGSTPELASSIKLLRAEQAAISQMKNRLAGRFNTDLIFSDSLIEPDTRESYIIMIGIDITLYHLYSQTGSKDVPEHRSSRYQDAIDWLKDVGNGNSFANLPSALTDTYQGEIRLWSDSKPENHNW